MKNLLLLGLCLFSFSSAFTQVEKLYLRELNNCIPKEYTVNLNSVDRSYAKVDSLYEESFNGYLTDSDRLLKLEEAFVEQVKCKEALYNIWLRSDSLSKVKSQKYFNEVAKAFKSLADSIDILNPKFISSDVALFYVERMHKIIILERFGIQVCFGCISDDVHNLAQPTDFNTDIVVNIDMIKRFRTAWNETQYPLTYDNWTYTPTERRPFSRDYYATKWDNANFIQKKPVSETLAESEQSETISSKKTEVRNTETIVQKPVENVTDRESIGNPKSVGNRNNHKKATRSSNIHPASNSGLIIENDAQGRSLIKVFIGKERLKNYRVQYYTIQVAASRNKLDLNNLGKRIYKGNSTVEERYEDGWYKYTVGQFTSIDSANKYLNSSAVLQGFVSGYDTKSQRVAIFSMKQPQNLSISAYSLIFRLQIAASRKMLEQTVLSNIYKGNKPINITQEDGWYKYSIGDYMYIDEAISERETCKVKGAFIASYRDGVKVSWPSKEGLLQQQSSQNSLPIYVIQVAASRNSLSTSVIKSILTVDYPLTVKFEDGWYKYFISAFSSYSAALNHAKQLNIPGAFIATYKNGKRVNP